METENNEKKHPLAWLSKNKSIKAILLILSTLILAIIIMVLGFLLGYAGVNIWVSRTLFIIAGICAVISVILYQFVE